MYIVSYFAEAGVPKTGLSPTITARQVSDNSVVVNAQAMSEIGGGWYKYNFSTYDEDEDYTFVCDGGAVLDDIYRYVPGATSVEGEVTEINNWVVSGGGANQVTVQVYEEGTVDPIEDVHVYVKTQAGFLESFGSTNVSGQFITMLDDATYNVYLSKPGVGFDNPNEIVVTVNETFTMYGDPASITPPNPDDACRVYEYCFMPDGITPIPNPTTEIIALIIRPPDSDADYYKKSVPGVYNENTGLLYWDIVQGAQVRFNIPDLKVKKTVTIPDQANVMLHTLPDES